MNTFFTADTHFFHANIIKYCSRPFKSSMEMNRVIRTNWNERVGVQDTVIHLGDFAFSSKLWQKAFLQSLHGKKILIRGNHDYKAKCMLEIGFEEVYEQLTWNEWTLVHRPRQGEQILCGHIHNHWKRIGNVINVGVDV